MRRGTPSAELFGGLLAVIRLAGSGRSMGQVGDRIGAPPATVSQVERGERALKEPKVAAWASSLDVSAADLLELWSLSQGQVPVGHDRFVFYADRPEVLGSESLRPDIVSTLQDRPDLEPIYRLAERIVVVLRRALPHAGFQVDADQFEPPHIDKMAAELKLTATEQHENEAAAAAFAPVPVIECDWAGLPGIRRPRGGQRAAVRVPLLHELAPIVRRRGTSVKKVELEDLIRDLSGLERERVRGYIEAIVEQRAAGSAGLN